MVLSATTIADEPRVLLAFGVGFSYQLGLDDPGSSKRDGVDLGAAGHDAPSAGTSSGCHIGDGNDGERSGEAAPGGGKGKGLDVPSCKRERWRCTSKQPMCTGCMIQQ